MTFFSSAGVMYSASFSIRCVTDATPAVKVGVASGDEEMTAGADAAAWTGAAGEAGAVGAGKGGAGKTAGAVGAVTGSLPAALATLDKVDTLALAGLLARLALLPVIFGSAGIRFMLVAFRRDENVYTT